MARKQDIFGVTVDGDITGLKKKLNEATRELKSTERSIKNINKAIQADPSDKNLIEQRAKEYKKAIQEAEQEVKNLKKLIREITSDENFNDKTALSEQFTTLQKQLKESEAKLKQFKTEFKELNDITRQAFDVKADKFFEQMKKSSEALDRVKDSLKNVNESIELDPNNLDLYIKKQELLSQAVRIGETTLREYYKRLNELKEDPGYLQGWDNLREEFTRVETNAKELEKQLVLLKQEASDSPELARFKKQFLDLGDAFKQVGEQTRLLSTAFQGILSSSFESFKSMESDIANIKRVVSDLKDSTVDDLKTIAVETGTAFSDIAEYATIAGALGIAEKDISGFARAMTDLNTATGGAFSGEEGAKGIAVFLKQLNLGIDQVENFGSAIAVIGDKYADIGDETVNVATKISGLTSIVKINQYELLGLAGVMSDLGLSSETNANAINRAFLQIESNIATSETKLGILAETANMSSEEFKQAWETNALDAFLKFTDGLRSNVFNEINDAVATSDSKVQEFADTLGWSADLFKEKWGENSREVFDLYIDKLGELEDGSESAATVLKDLGISSVNTAQTLLRLSGSGNKVREAVKLATKAWNENTALQEKAGIIYDTTERKLQGLYESIKQFGGGLIDAFAPTIKQIIDNLTVLFEHLKNMSPVMQQLVTYFIGFGAAVSPASTAIGNITDYFKKGEDGISKYGKTLNALTNIFTAGFPLGIIAAVTALMVALGKLEWDTYKKSVEEYYAPIVNLKDGLQELHEKTAQATTEFQLNEAQIRLQSQSIDELVESLGLLNDDEEKSIETKNKIKETLDKLNSSLGENKFFFDEVKGAIVDEKGEIVDLTDLYPQLALERKKSYYMDQYQELYMQALEAEQKAIQDRIDKQFEFDQALQGSSDKVKELWNVMFSDDYTDSEKMSFLAKADEDTLNAYNSLLLLKAETDKYIQTADEVMEHSSSIIKDYESIANASYEEIDRLIASIDLNGKFNTNREALEALGLEIKKLENYTNSVDYHKLTPEQQESIRQQLQAYKDQRDEIELTLKESQDYYKKVIEDEKEKVDYQKQGSEEVRKQNEDNYADMTSKSDEHTKKVIENTDSIAKKETEYFDENKKKRDTFYTDYKNLYEGKDGITEINSRNLQTMQDSWGTFTSEVRKKIVSDVSGGIAEAQAVANANPITIQATVHVDDSQVRAVTQYDSPRPYQLLRSSGLGISPMLFDRGALAKSGLIASGGIGVTANINVYNNGTPIDDGVVSRWVDIIADKVDTTLGRKF